MKLFALFLKSYKQPTETHGYILELLITTLKRLSLRHWLKFDLEEYVLGETSAEKVLISLDKI